MMKPSSSTERTAERIHAARILPVLRTKTSEESYQMALRLLTLGIGAIELTTTTEGWLDAMIRLRTEAPDALVGAGTVVNRADAERAIEAGAEFLVSPYPVPAVRSLAAERDILLIEGSFTPGELAAATSRGVAKIFPAHVGGIAYLRSMLAVLPGARIIPTGGIPASEAAQWLEAGAFAVGVGSDLYSSDGMDAISALLASVPGTGR